MKKLTAIFLSLLLLGVSMKPAVAWHYCGGELAGVKLVAGYGTAGCQMQHEPMQAHDDGQQVHAPGCCRNEISQLIPDEYSFGFVPQVVSASLEVPVAGIALNVVPAVPSLAFPEHLPRPPLGITSVSLPVIGVFII